jgi:hypothetical protein
LCAAVAVGVQGLLSSIMRDLARAPNEDTKWIVLDGDLDANWIESMNSVMDDNKVRDVLHAGDNSGACMVVWSAGSSLWHWLWSWLWLCRRCLADANPGK